MLCIVSRRMILSESNRVVSMDRLLAYLATVGEVTQDNMSSIGNAFNTIFARMGSIKLSRLDEYKEETGEDLKNWGVAA